MKIKEIPERLICQATREGKPVSGVMIRAGFGVWRKNAYVFLFGPTNHDGCVVITREEVLRRADDELNTALMDFDPLPGSFSGDISLKVEGNEDIKVVCLK